MPLQAVLPQAVDEVSRGGFEQHLDRLGNLPFSYGCTLAESCGKHVLLRADNSRGPRGPIGPLYTPSTTPRLDPLHIGNVPYETLPH